MLPWLLACVPDPSDDDAESAPDTTVLLDALTEVDLDGSSSERDTHPVVDRTEGGTWVTTWDAGSSGFERALVRWLAPDGAPDAAEATVLALGAPGDGFLTPDMQVDGDMWFGAVRVGGDIQVLAGPVGSSVPSSGPTPVGAEAGIIDFWTAPDLAVLPASLVIAWWDGELAPGNPATYQLAHVSDTLDVSPSETLGDSDDAGSPVALEPTPDGGFLVAWSTSTAEGTGTITVQRFDASGERGALQVFGEGEGLVSRPTLAVDPSGAWAIGWRVQDAAQNGLGVSFAVLDAEDHQVGSIVRPGLRPDTANRIDLSAHDGILAASWEETGVDGDVLLQLFDLADTSRLTGALRVHDDPNGDQARPTVVLRPGPDDLAVGVAWESIPTSNAASSVRFRVFQVVR